MDKIRLGKTDLIVNKNGFGALPIQRANKEDSEKLLKKPMKMALTSMILLVFTQIVKKNLEML